MRTFLLLLLATLIVGCGGGSSGGGTGQNAVLVGRVLWIETNAATDPASTVTAGSNVTTTDLIDGSFSFAVSEGTTSVTVSLTPAGSSTPVIRTFTFPPASGTTDLGDLYVGPGQVTVTGTVIDASTLNPVPGATVRIGGRSAVSNANGDFSVLNVAYSASSPAAFGDLVGEVTKTGYVTRLFSPPVNEVGGVVDVGEIQISPESLDDPPPLPANITGSVLPLVDGGGATVELLDGIVVIRTTVADGQGQFSFWAPVGSYTVSATAGSKSGSEAVTVTSPNVQKVVNVTVI